VRDHAVPDAAAGKALWLGAAKNTEDIVLRAREAVRLEELRGFETQRIGNFLKRDKNLGFHLLGRVQIGPATHGMKIVVMTTNVKREYIFM
jgi:hypothetical protein